MNANELRIGNWFTGFDNKPFQFNIEHFYLLLETYDIDEIVKEPITLTEEWLLKFGFEKDKRSGNSIKVWHYGENPLTFDYMIRIKNIGEGYFYQNGHFKIKYVHHLQNLYFALTGEELTIN